MSEQTASEFPFVPHDQRAIIRAANDRARYWGYPANGPWTVTITTPRGSLEVHKPADGDHQFGALIKVA